MTPLPAPRALVVINGDDVYEDLFSAGLKLAEILSVAGFAARTTMGTARLADRAAVGLLVLYTALGDFPRCPSVGARSRRQVRHRAAGGARVECLPQAPRPDPTRLTGSLTSSSAAGTSPTARRRTRAGFRSRPISAIR